MAKKIPDRTKTGFSLQGWDLAHYKRTEGYTKAIDALYNSAIAEFARMATRISIDPDKPFSFDAYPATKAMAAKITQGLASKMKTVIQSGSEQQWLYANKKNDEFLKSILNTSKVPKETLAKYQDRNLDALKTFQARKVNGMDLSNRIWNQAEQFKKTMELGIDVGLGEGKSAQKLSKDLRENLLDPDRLFRRVRDKNGQLQLSKAAQAFHPGQGNYRSSYKNAMRLTRSEINMAYRSADNLRYKKLDFIVGFEVKLSNNHTLNGEPFTDICDELAGKYPKNFIFKGWHPQCRCFSVPILQDPEEFDTDELNELKAALNGTEYNKLVSKNTVTDLPDSFKSWMGKNQEKVDGYKSTPYFVKDNFKNGKIADGLMFDTTKVVKVAPTAQKAPALPVKPVEPPKPKQLTVFEQYASQVDAVTSIAGVKKVMTAHLKEQLGYETKVLISEADTSLAVAKAYAKEFVALTNTYELEMPCLKFYTAQARGHYGQVSVVNAEGKKPRSYSEFVGKAQNTGQRVDPARLRDFATEKSLCDQDRHQLSTITHEFAHNIFMATVNKSPRALEFKRDLLKVKNDYHEELVRLMKSGIKDSQEFKDIYLGKYASTNMDEFLAEAFQEYRNRKTPSKYAKLVGELVDKHYKKK